MLPETCEFINKNVIYKEKFRTGTKVKLIMKIKKLKNLKL